MKENERLKDDGRLDVNITVCYQLKVTISDGRGIGDPVKNSWKLYGSY